MAPISIEMQPWSNPKDKIRRLKGKQNKTSSAYLGHIFVLYAKLISHTYLACVYI